MTRTLSILPLSLLALLMMAAPAAMAQESNETPSEKPAEQPSEKPSETSSEPQDGGDAWVKDCPPDMMCAYSHAGGADQPATCDADNETRDDCVMYKGDGAEPTRSDNCMDGSQEGEICRPSDCEYCRTLGGAEDGAASDKSANAAPVSDPADADTGSEARNTVPGAALVGTLVALGIAGLALRRRA